MALIKESHSINNQDIGSTMKKINILEELEK